MERTSATPVSKEAIRLLVIQHGQREAARIAGLNENTVRSWAMRYNWSATNPQPKPIPPSKSGITALTEKIASELSDNDRETRLSLSRYARKASQKAESKGLKDAPIVHKLAQTAAIVGDWRSNKDNDQASVAVNIAILSV